jgi:hypothetical protein|tara:strand:+ start:339 stop:470 length:132 start_codon:yes stop_codon:yes gene_type:complete
VNEEVMTDKEIIEELVLMLTTDYADLLKSEEDIIEQRLRKLGL